MIAARSPAGARWSFVALAISLALGAFLRFWQLSTKSLFLDEAFSIFVGGVGLHGFFAKIAHGDVHPPLFYLYAHAAIATLHWPREDYRWLTAPLGLVTILATWAIARRSFGDAVAAVAALLVAVEPVLVSFDRLFRMYAPLAALTTASWWALVVAVESTGTKRRVAWIVYGLIAIALPYTQYLGWFVVASQLVYAAFRWRAAWPAAVCAAIAALAFAPWIWAVRIQYPLGGLVGVGPGVRFYWLGIARTLIAGSGFPLEWLRHGTAVDAAIAAAVAIVVVAALILGRSSLLPFWLLPAFAQIAVSLLSGKNLAIPRYFLYVVPALSCCIAIAIVALLHTRARLLGGVFFAVVLGVNLVALSNLLLVPRYQTTDWYAVDLLLLEHENPEDVFVFDQGMSYLIMRDFASVRGHRAYGANTGQQLGLTIENVDRWPHRRVWYVANQAWAIDPDERVLGHLRATRPALGAWDQEHTEPESTVYVALFGPMQTPRRR